MPLVQVPHERIAEMREKLHRHPAFTGQLDFAVGTSSKGDKVAWTATSRETGVPYNGKSFFIEGVLHHWSAISETGNMKHSKRYTKDELDTGIARFYTNAPADSKYAVHLRVVGKQEMRRPISKVAKEISGVNKNIAKYGKFANLAPLPRSRL